jgi:hypothetical protein
VLDGLKAQKGATWVGYSIAVKERISSGTRSNHVEYLEEDNSHTLTDSSEENIKSYDHALILVKVADGAVTKLHVVNADRALDAGGLPLVWLNGVDAEDSVRVLADLARRNDAEHLRDSAIFAISIHQNPAATAALISLTGEENDLKIREKVAFWLADLGEAGNQRLDDRGRDRGRSPAPARVQVGQDCARRAGRLGHLVGS